MAAGASLLQQVCVSEAPRDPRLLSRVQLHHTSDACPYKQCGPLAEPEIVPAGKSNFARLQYEIFTYLRGTSAIRYLRKTTTSVIR
jgi:hypothetical protein